jgi:phospholipid transport system transporter-binding protein
MSRQHGHLHDSAEDTEPVCGVCGAESPHFAAGSGRWLLAGALTVDTAASVLESSHKAALPKTGKVDLTGLDLVDSAGVAVLLAWRRRAAAEGVALAFSGAPASLAALAELYGVGEIVDQPARTAA